MNTGSSKTRFAPHGYVGLLVMALALPRLSTVCSRVLGDVHLCQIAADVEANIAAGKRRRHLRKFVGAPAETADDIRPTR